MDHDFVATTRITAICTLALAASSITAQTSPFPMTVTSRSAHEVTLTPDPTGLRRLATMDRVTLTDIPAPGQGALRLQLRRVTLHLGPNAVHVDGVAGQPGVAEDTSFWSGTIPGQTGSQAFLAFSKHGSRGWFGKPGQFVHMLAQPGPGNDWSTSSSRLVTERFLSAVNYNPVFKCAASHPPRTRTQSPNAAARTANNGPFIDAPIAFETDFEFYALFQNLPAAQTYAFTLLAAVGTRYREQLDVIWTIPYLGFYTTNNDPWTQVSCSSRLGQFRSKWRNGRAPVQAQLYHMLSGAKVSGCGGVSYIDVLCNQDFGFGLSGHLNAKMPFPPAQGPLTWDFMVIAHEVGHQFGSDHTHSYTPPIDRCATRNPCISNGTNMSFCHTCPGGMSNMTLMFHPRVLTSIRQSVSRSCLKKFDGILAKDLGHALRGSNGTPTQDLAYTSPVISLDVESAPKSQPGFLFFGVVRIDFPLSGGIMVPNPRAAAPIMSDATGQFHFTAPITNAFPGGLTFYLQSWFMDPTGPSTLAATNGTQIELIKP